MIVFNGWQDIARSSLLQPDKSVASMVEVPMYSCCGDDGGIAVVVVRVRIYCVFISCNHINIGNNIYYYVHMVSVRTICETQFNLDRIPVQIIVIIYILFLPPPPLPFVDIYIILLLYFIVHASCGYTVII